jgi:hypothetical protein
VVYSFRAETTPRKLWYDQWRSDVIAAYGAALEILGVHPYFCDVTTFCRQALARQLPDLVAAFNLNAGIAPIAHWAFMPAVSAWCDVPPLPTSADVLIVGERKDTASLMARELGLTVPTTYDAGAIASIPGETELVAKPRDLGGSVGIFRMTALDLTSGKVQLQPGSLVQEFVSGLDLTVPVVFQPSTGRHRAVAGVLYIPSGDDPFGWIHDERTKLSRNGYDKVVIPIPSALEDRICRYAAHAELGPYSRLDMRVATQCLDPASQGFCVEDAYFLEVNPMPTLRRGINFLDVVASATFREAFETEYRAVEGVVGPEAETDLVALAVVLAIALVTIDADYSHA